MHCTWPSWIWKYWDFKNPNFRRIRVLLKKLTFYTHSTANSTTSRDFGKNYDFSKTLPRNFFRLSLRNANISFALYGDFDKFWWKKVRNCAILDFYVFVECKKRKRWVHDFQPKSWQRSAAVLRNWFRRHTTNQIKQEQLIYEGATVLQKLMIRNLNRNIIAVILTNVETSVKSMNSYSSCFALHLKQTHTMQNSPCKKSFARKRERMNKIKATLEPRGKCVLWAHRKNKDCANN